MKKLGLLLAMSAVSVFAGEMTGYVSESGCGAKHADASEGSVKCVTSCIKKGAKPVLVVDGKVVAISNPDKVPADLYGKKVTVTGEESGGSVTVASIKAAS